MSAINNDFYQIVFLIDEYLWAKTVPDSSNVNYRKVVRHCVLKVLTYFAGPTQVRSCCENDDRSINARVEWGLKFFSSNKTTKVVRDKPRFREFSLKKIEDFENELEGRLNLISAHQQASEFRSCSSPGYAEAVDVFNSVKLSLRTVIYDFPWDKPDIASPVKLVRKRSNSSSRNKTDVRESEVESNRRNFVFVVCNCPHIVDSSSISSGDVLKSFLPVDIRQQLVENLGIRLFWINVSGDNLNEGTLCKIKDKSQLVDDALQVVGGRLIPSSALSNPGTLHLTYVGNLFRCFSNDCSCRSDCMDCNELNNESSELQTGVTALPVIPLSSVMEFYMQNRSVFKSTSDVSVVLRLTTDSNHGSPILYNLNLHPVYKDVKSRLLEKVVDQHGSCSLLCGTSKEDQLPIVGSNHICMVPFAAVCAGTIPQPLFSSSDIYLITVGQVSLSGVSCSTINPSDCQFQDLLILLTQTNQVLLLRTVGSQFCQAVLQPLSLTTATLSFLSGPVDVVKSDLDGTVSQLRRTSPGLSVDAECHSVEINDPIHLWSNAHTDDTSNSVDSQSLSRFNPAVLEAWYSPEGSTDAADAIVTSLHTQNVARVREEQKLLRQLRLHYTSSGAQQAADTMPFHSPRSKRYLARQHHRENGVSLSIGLDEEINADPRKSDKPHAVRQSFSVSEVPVKKQKVLSNTPAKKLGRTPRKTPRKRSGRTPKKLTRLTPGKMQRPVAAKRGLPESSATMWRASLIMQKSREAMQAKKTTSKEDASENNEMSSIYGCKLLRQKLANEQFTTTGWHDISSEDSLVKELRMTYDKVVEGEGTPLIGAKSIVTSSIHFYRNIGEVDIPKRTCDLLSKHFLVKLQDLHSKYKGQEGVDAKASKLTEYQLQVLLRMEMDAECGSQGDEENDSTESLKQHNEIVRALQAMSFIKDPGFLSIYLSDTLLANYSHSAPKLLYQIYSELMLPIPVELEHLRTPEEAEQSVPMPSISASSSHSMLSTSIRSGELRPDIGQPRKLYRSVTFTQPSQRQIQVPVKKLPVASTVTTPARRSSRIASATKTKINQPANVSETKKVRRMLFDGNEVDKRLSLPSGLSLAKPDSCQTQSERWTPKKSYCSLKTKVISETPAHKQGNRLQMKLELRQKRLSIDPSSTVAVAESPIKYCDDKALQSTGSRTHETELLKRDSFYSDKQSHNPFKFTKLEQRMTQRISSPPSETFVGNYVVGSFLTSPRRITPKALFGTLLSPSPERSQPQIVKRRISTRQPGVVGSPILTDESTRMFSPSRSTRSRSLLSEIQPNKFVVSPECTRLSFKSSTTAAPCSPPLASEIQKECFESNDSTLQSNPLPPKAMSGTRKRIAFCEASKQQIVPDTAVVDLFSSPSLIQSSGCADLAGGISSVISTTATPLSKDKKHIKTPDSLDKWPRKKNRALMGCSPKSTSSVGRFASSGQEVLKNVFVACDYAEIEQQQLDNQSSACRDSEEKLPPETQSISSSCAISLTASRQQRKKNLATVTTRSVWDNSESTSTNPPHRFKRQTKATNDGISSQMVDKKLDLFGTDCDTGFETKSKTECLEMETPLVNENEGPLSNCNDRHLNQLRKGSFRNRSVKSRWSSGFSSGSLNSFSERSQSPVFPVRSHRQPDVVNTVCTADVTDSETRLPSPIFDRRSQCIIGNPVKTDSGSGSKPERLLRRDVAKSFSPSITDGSLMHLMMSPLLDVVNGKLSKSSSGRGSSTRRCLEQQLCTSVTRQSPTR